MINILCKYLLLCSILTINLTTVNAISDEYNDSINDYEINVLYKDIPETKDFGNMSIQKSVKLAGLETDLYVEFDDLETAIHNFKDMYKDVIDYLREEFELSELTVENFDKYYEAFLELSSYPDSEYYYELNLFDGFARFKDIFENTETNLEIESIVNEINLESNDLVRPEDIAYRLTGVNETAVSDRLIDVYYLLPNWSPIVQEVEMNESKINTVISGPLMITPFGLSTSAKTKAINYASKYAVTPNSANYKVFGKDCTNFTSQILEAAGVAQVVTTSEHTGWWHKRTKVSMPYDPGYYYTHKHSVSWIRASTFARYMGTGPGRGPSQYKTFTQLAVSGDFIGLDKTSDGDIDHTAFITAKGSPDNKGVYNLRIAQHTKNYHAWTSESINGWENMKPGELYHFIRS